MYKFKPTQGRNSSEEQLSSASTSMEDDKQFLLDESRGFKMPKRSRSWVNWKAAAVAFNVLLFVGGLSVWGHVIVLLKSLRCDTKPEVDHFEPDLLYNSAVTFQPHAYMGGAPSNATDEMWQRLSPPGDGIVEVPNEFTHNLPASLPAPNNPETHKVYGVSMFHQLHCLNFLRFAYYPEAVTDMTAEEVVFHRDHCLDYIRQAIMCAGDATFEPLTKVGINGMGATHQCRDFERVFSWAYEHRSDKQHGSGYKGGKVTHTPGHRNDFDEDEAEEGGHHHH
ncbi:uncharacterized protein LTHEOB_2736 [Lasiodiplodia theobromae]|uniref:Oxidase ustYa n=1 Tax=Lasiodiplodia theobromae TaxID=45133 RepID=A0A5N5CZD5_9PEZI|nr:uncharacterized protein LTHEOB_2736 [Lasiodiplodia theobromae]KAB2570614.1 Oxidase ustYa [Lasiodiplodia theobromae]KAF4534761.1 hypothetical protein LTHEOB_2736 [Lasiodiplodia theobromae]